MDIHLNFTGPIHLHFGWDSAAERLFQQGARIMGKVEDLTAALEQLNTVTNTLADHAVNIRRNEEFQNTELQRLRDLLSQGQGIPPEALDPLIARSATIKAAMQTVEDSLRPLAVDITNPAPPPPPPPPVDPDAPPVEE